MTTTVRALIREMQTEVRDSDLTPDRAAELVTKLAALYGNVLDEVRRTELAFNAVVRAYLSEDGVALNKAEMLAKGAPEYEEWRIARDTETLTKQLLSSLKAMLRAKADELRFTPH
jgi:hypothetical protein